MIGRDLTFSSLYNYIGSQKHLIYNRDIPYGSYLCEACENACILAKEINKSRNVHLPTDLHDLVEKYGSNSDSKHCMYENFDKCIINRFGDEELASNIMYQNWCHQYKKDQNVSLSIDYVMMITTWTPRKVIGEF